MNKIYVPIWELDENEFFILTEDMMDENKEALQSRVRSIEEILVLSNLCLPVRYDLIDPKHIAHVETTLDWAVQNNNDPVPIAVISGPIYDAGKENMK